MMTDTNVVIDLREADSRWFDWSLNTLALTETGRFMSSVVLGELASRGGPDTEIMALLDRFDITPLPLSIEAGLRAGSAHHAYRRAGGTRETPLADFLIGAHAVTANLPLITRDPRRYRTYFPELTLITPESHP